MQENIVKYSAVIIEPRPHPAFELVLDNFFRHLDERWIFIIFHGNQNKKFLDHLINDKFASNKERIKFVHLNIDNLSLYNYNMLMRTKQLYDYIDTEMLLIFQLDSLISDVYYNNIYDFMDYDYVGAPWPVHFPNNVGNGGLSLRRKSKMIEIIDNHNLPDWHNEDGYFSSYENMKKPSHEEAGRFSVECIYNEKSFGIHKAWNHLHKHEVDIISKHIPSIYKLQELYDSYTSNDSFTIITDMKNIFPDA
jgi:hypothetical protein